VDLLEETERWEASPHQARQSAEGLNEMTMEEVLSRENLNAAYRVVKANAGAPGVDGMSVEELKEHVRKHWETLQSKLRTGQYQPAAVRAVEIPKAKGGVRTLGIPTVVDRLIQQGVHQVLSPIFEKDFSNHSYGFRPERSAHDAVRAAQEYVKAGKGWVVDIDLKAFFDQVNHDKLMNLVGRKIRDKEILKLIGKYLRAPMQRAGKKEARDKGTPQGGPLSPLLANIYLDPLDKELEKWSGTDRAKWTPGVPDRRRRDNRNRGPSGPTSQGTGTRTLGRATEQDQSAAESTVAKLHQRVVELLPTGRKAMERKGPQRLDPSTHAQVLLATVA